MRISRAKTKWFARTAALLILVLGMLASPLLQRLAYAATVSDNFNRANGGLGSNWTTVKGAAAPAIVNDTLAPGTANALNSAYWSANTFGSNQYAQANMPASSGSNYGPGVAVRLSNSKGYFLWYGNTPNQVSIWRMDGATSWTQIAASGNLTIASADVWMIQAVGSTISAYQNGNLVAKATDKKYTTGSPGVWMYWSSNQITNWSGGDLTSTTYSVGGTVSGLSSGKSVILADNGGDNLTVTANGAFAFATSLAPGAAYNVTVAANPAGQTCTVANGTGAVGSANITNVAVTCTANPPLTFSVGGTAAGLSGTVVLQDNGGDNLTVTANGAFAFATSLAPGAAYNVTVAANPAGQTCTVANGTGAVGSANITNVAVTCAANSSGSASDDFSRANGSLGPNWTDFSVGGLKITSQAAAGSNSGNSGDMWAANSFGSDQFSAVQVTSTQLSGGQWIGPAVRAQNGGQSLYTGIYWWNNGNPELRLYLLVSGSWEQLGASYNSGALAAGTTLELTATGTTISFLENNVPVITATDASLTGGAPGIVSYQTGQVDNWSGGNMVAAPSYSIGGTVTGLSGTAVLQDNGGDTLSIAANGTFTFGTALPSGLAYGVTVASNPTGQTCTVANGTGIVGSANVTNVTVTCTNNASGSGTDNFNRADGPLGPNWTDFSDGGLTITSQIVAGTNATGYSGDMRTGEVYNSNQYSQIQLTSTQLTGGQWIGPAVRMQAGGQDGYVGAYSWNNGSPEVLLFSRAGTTWNQLGTDSTGALAAGTTLKLEVVGSTLAFLVNGVERIAVYDTTYTTGTPGIMAYGTPQAGNWAGGTQGFEVHYLSTDANGVQTYDTISANNGYGPQYLRVLNPANPAPGVAHSFLYVLPVEVGEGSVFGDGMQTMESLNAQNQYNLTIIEPSFGIEPWYADNPVDANEQEETFMTTELVPWVKANLATTGTEQSWLIGFSKSGIGGQDLILKHPDLFTLAASWDFPADMNSYDQYGTSPEASYGTDANFQANYRLTASFLAARKAPFLTNNRIWIGSYQLYRQDVSDYDALLTSAGIPHSTQTPTSMAHRWDSGWVPLALAALYQDSIKYH